MHFKLARALQPLGALKISWLYYVLILAAGLLFPGRSFGSDVVPADLRCQGVAGATGVDVAVPKLSWMFSLTDPAIRGVTQTGYQILAGTTSAVLQSDTGDLWDSGWVAGANSAGIPYRGRPLHSGQVVYWKVRTRTSSLKTASEISDWSAISSFTLGQLNPADWEPAKWIGLTPDVKAGVNGQSSYGPRSPAVSQPASLLARRRFVCGRPVTRAVLFVTGLGQYEATLNGTDIGAQLLSPGWTDYRKTVLYDTFDVTNQIRTGANTLGLILGNGVYHIESTAGRYVKYTNSFGVQKAIAKLQLQYADGTTDAVVTDSSWQVTGGPITYSNEFGGEDFDQRMNPPGWDLPAEADPGLSALVTDKIVWTPALELEGPGGRLRGLSVSAPPIKAIETLPAVVSKDSGPVTIYDLGQNASVMPRLTVRGPAGSRVRITPSELLKPDGSIDRASCVQDAGGPAWWQYTLAGGIGHCFPKFFYQGCRYLRVERFPVRPGDPLPELIDIAGVVVHSSAVPAGSFQCSNDLFNKTGSLVRWAQRSNMMSLMTDCPHREKLGWLEELHLNGPSLRFNFAMDRLFDKEVNDMADAQLSNGFVPNIAPEYFLAHTDKLDDPFRGSPEWGSAFIIVPWQQYLFTGDTTLLSDHYGQMKRYVDYLSTTATDDLLPGGLGDWYDIGPKPAWGSQLTPPPFTASAIYFYDNQIMTSTARLLDKRADEASFRARCDRIRISFNRKFFDPVTNRYSTGSQCTSAMPLVLGLVDPDRRGDVLKALIDDVRSRGNGLSAGDVGYRFVLRALADAGRSDVVFDMNNQSDRPGYGMQLKKGATSLTEKWDGSVGRFGSQNHFMLGQINEWFFNDLVGIGQDPDSAGFARIVIRPAFVGDVTWVRGSYLSVRGRIDVYWTRQLPDPQRPGRVTLEVTIPPNTTAVIDVPTHNPETVMESDHPISQVPGVKSVPAPPGFAGFAVGSGTYRFTAE